MEDLPVKDADLGNKKNRYGFANPEINSEKWLYHYTSFETAIKYILPNGTLKMGAYGNVNDPKEARIIPTAVYHKSDEMFQLRDKSPDEFFTEETRILNEIKSYFERKIKIVCISTDDIRYEKTEQSNFAKGFYKPRMWAQYGDANKGVCLIFNREILTEQIKKQLVEKGDLYCGNVTYESCEKTDDKWRIKNRMDINSSSVYLQKFQDDFDTAMQNQIKTYANTYFFHKHEDWKAESEYRYAIHSKEDGDLYISYGKSLAGIVVGVDFPNYHEKALMDVAKGLEIGAIQINWGISGKWQRPLGKNPLVIRVTKEY
jgi:Protein of unknown function (DUF2971)